MTLHLKIVGGLLMLLALMHIFIPRYFKWDTELTSITLITKQILYVHTFFIAFTVLLVGILCISYSHELVTTRLGGHICLGLFGFWFTRLIFQFLVYSPETWKGKRFETIMHIFFSMLWMYFSGVFVLSYVQTMK